MKHILYIRYTYSSGVNAFEIIKEIYFILIALKKKLQAT